MIFGRIKVHAQLQTKNFPLATEVWIYFLYILPNSQQTQLTSIVRIQRLFQTVHLQRSEIDLFVSVKHLNFYSFVISIFSVYSS